MSSEYQDGLTVKSLIRLPVNDVSDCVLFLKRRQTVHVFGSLSLRKLAGSLSIHGHDLDDENWHSVCSCGPHLITLKCGSISCDWQRIYSSPLLEAIKRDENKLTIKKCTRKFTDIGSVVLLKSAWLTSRLQCQDLFDLSCVLDSNSLERRQKELHEKTSDLNFTLFSDVPPPLSPLIMSTDWPSLPCFVRSHSINQDSRSSVVLVCGGKGVGKSTFARYLVNKLLNTEKSLCFLETDVGQSELTPPGVLSLNEVDTPIFGPPFCHLSRPKKAYFFGDVSPKDRPSTYIRLIHMLHQHFKEHYRGMQLVVNTHGWVKGMGVRILLDIIRIVQPTHIIQINCQTQPTKNLPELTPEFLEKETGWNYPFNEERETLETSLKCSSQIYQMKGFKCATEGKGVSLQASELRSLSLLSYFGSSQQSTSNVITVQEHILHHCTVYSLPISTLRIYNCSENVPRSQVLFSINGSIVGLVKMHSEKINLMEGIEWRSHLAEEISFGEYVGLGIVRNIDPNRGLLFITTPEPLQNLSDVNALVKGKLEIPDSLFKNHSCAKRPYLTSEFTYNHRGSGAKRIRYNLLRQRPGSPHPTDKNP